MVRVYMIVRAPDVEVLVFALDDGLQPAAIRAASTLRQAGKSVDLQLEVSRAAGVLGVRSVDARIP
jgi:histidyl-tRNA synthetase